MIELKNLCKNFDDKEALANVNLTFESGTIYGLVGTNGSGKSTMLRLISGIYSPDSGLCTLDGKNIFDNNKAKDEIVFIPDDLYFLNQATLNSMARFYKTAHKSWSDDRYKKLCSVFPLDPNKKLSTFSKGMRRQAAFILALSCQPKYLLLDEAFDGIDPVIRHGVRQLISDIIAEDNLCCIISSHNLRELEDFCDSFCLLHNGKIQMVSALDKISDSYCKIQMALNDAPEKVELPGIKILSQKKQGSLITLILSCGEERALDAVSHFDPIFSEAIPLTLEEVFIYEMEAIGYDYSKIVF